MALAAQIALVTGASRGIGRAIALELGGRGATVVGTATAEAGAEMVSGMLAEHGVAGRGAVLDVADDASVEALFEALNAESLMPGIVVNNAGVTRDNLMMRMQPGEWDEVVNTNLNALYRMSRACVRHMVKARNGRIINVASVVAATGNPGQSNYCAAKAGVIGFTKALARELSTRGITVNAVAPGLIDTDMTCDLSDAQREALLSQIPLSRFGSVEDVAGVVAFLASDGAGYITGETVHVNGGMHMA